MSLEPVHDEAALVATAGEDEAGDACERRVLVVGDLHLGIDIRLKRQGLFVPDMLERFLGRMETLLQTTDPTHVVLLGDVKDSIGVPTKGEKAQLQAVLDLLTDHDPALLVLVTPGNHDGGLGRFLEGRSRVSVHNAGGAVLPPFGFAHGHALPAPGLLDQPFLVIGHLHPQVSFTDSIGTRIVKRCWLRVRGDRTEGDGRRELVIVPGFNELCGGLVLNEKKDGLKGLLKAVEVDLRSGEVVLLDGTHLGHLCDLEHGIR